MKGNGKKKESGGRKVNIRRKEMAGVGGVVCLRLRHGCMRSSVSWIGRRIGSVMCRVSSRSSHLHHPVSPALIVVRVRRKHVRLEPEMR
jgi:hypothetical protein